jgi:tetratricopeptide (TPR) repeat protein
MAGLVPAISIREIPRATNFVIMPLDFNELERRALALRKAGRFRDAMAIYFFMGDGDPSLDAGYLAYQIAMCHEALGDLHAAKWWYGRALEENPRIPKYQEARRRLENIGFDKLPST